LYLEKRTVEEIGQALDVSACGCVRRAQVGPCRELVSVVVLGRVGKKVGPSGSKTQDETSAASAPALSLVAP